MFVSGVLPAICFDENKRVSLSWKINPHAKPLPSYCTRFLYIYETAYLLALLKPTFLIYDFSFLLYLTLSFFSLSIYI